MHLVRICQNTNIDWNGNCQFDDDVKVIVFNTSSTKNSFGIQPIPSDNTIVEDAKKAKVDIAKALEPAKREEIALAIKKLSLHCGMQKRSPDEVRYMFNDYCQDLKEYPVALIELACTQVRMNPEKAFLPSSGELVEVIRPRFNKLKSLHKRILQILGEDINEQADSIPLHELLNRL